MKHRRKTRSSCEYTHGKSTYNSVRFALHANAYIMEEPGVTVEVPGPVQTVLRQTASEVVVHLLRSLVQIAIQHTVHIFPSFRAIDKMETCRERKKLKMLT